MVSLTWDRLAYTQHCFARLREHAGTAFTHWVLDQGSTDGTRDWLDSELEAERIYGRIPLTENVGIHRGLNRLLDEALLDDDFDVVVKFDNDCELVAPDTLRRCCEAALDLNAIVSPEIHGIGSVSFPEEYEHTETSRAGEHLWLQGMVGGIFMAVPGHLFGEYGFRFDEAMPRWGGADSHLCRWFRNAGGRCGYLAGLRANHYRGTLGQEQELPWYFERKARDGCPV